MYPPARRATAAAPVTPAEFAAAMDRLGPWDSARRLAVAVSGGPDSLCLALLLRHWGDPAAFIVDHGLRAGSAAEAAAAQSTLAQRGIAGSILRLRGLAPGSGIAERAREARYAALSAACREAGLVDLVLGHHAGDQAETVLLRQRAGSGPRGLASMASLTEAMDVRLLRPLLGFAPERLAAVVAQAGLTAAQDPTNDDLRTTRARLRREIGSARAGLLAEAATQGRARAARDAGLAAELAARVRLYPAGFAVMSPGPVAPDVLAAVLRLVSGRRYPVAAVASLAAAPRSATLAGARLLPAGRLGPGWLVVREAAAMAGALPAAADVVWDGRFRVGRVGSGCTVGALGEAAAGLRRRSPWPAAVLRSLPALRHDSTLFSVPFLDYDHRVDDSASPGWPVLHSAAVPCAGAGFVACCR